MTQPVGPPAAPNVQNIAERAERIIKRAEANTKDEVKNIGDNSKNVRGKTERLPEQYQDAPNPQKVEGRVVSVEGNVVKIDTPDGRVTIKTDVPPDIRAGQKVAVELPANSRIGDAVRISYATETQDIELPPDIKLPPTSATADYPPVKENDVVLATPQPISNYSAYITSTATSTPANYPPAELITIADKLPEALASAARVITVTPKLQAVIQNFDLAEQPLPQIYDAAPVPRPVLTQPLQTTPTQLPQTDAVENVLTQAHLKSPVAEVQKTTQKFSTNLIAALAEIGQPPQPQTPSPFATAGEKPTAQILRSFQQLNVLAVIPENIPQANLKPIVAEALSKNIKSQKSAPIPQGEIVLANVAGATKDGQTILSLPATKDSGTDQPRLLYVQTQIFADTGAQLLLNISEAPIGSIPSSPELISALPQSLQTQITQSIAAAATQTNPASALPPALMQPSASFSWPAMQEAIDVLSQVAPQAAQNIQSTLPAPSPRMVSSALFFIAALKLGNLENWLGSKNMDAIETAGKKGLLQRLSGDFGRMSSQLTEQSTGQWKTLTLPMLFEGEISNIQFHVRPDDHQKENENGEIEEVKKTRFVLDLTLSKMGPMQLDGFLTPKTLDMILRNQDRLAENDRQELMKIFSNTLELTGLKGSLSFQNKAENWVHVS